jgi:hypothetical protein
VNNPHEQDLVGYVVGALEAQEQRDLQAAIDANPEIEEQLLAIKRALLPLDDLDFTGSRPGLARRTCELVANIGQPPIRRLDPTRFQDLSRDPSNPHAVVASVINDVLHPESNPESSVGLGSAPSANGSPQSKSGSQDAPNTQTGRDTRFWLSAVSQRERGWGLTRNSRFSPVDVVVTAAAVMILAGLLFPAISYTRHQSRLTDCQNNLRQIGEKLAEYSELNNGRFVEIPRSGPLAVAGVVAPVLKDKGLLSDDSLFACAGVAASSDQQVKIPKIRSIKKAIGERLVWLQKTMSGNYGYTLGYQTSNGYQTPMNLARPNVVLMSDAPAVGQPNRISTNHGGYGQNCLFEDGHVQYVVGETIGNDAIFVNDYNMVAPGCHAEDNVIAPSHLSPLFPMSQ